jgi:mannosyltransferase
MLKLLKHKPLDHWYRAGIIVLFGVFLAIRLYRLGSHDIWYDENATISYARYPWHNWNAPLYWIVMHFWVKIAGMSEFSLRLPSAVFSFLSVVIVALAGKELFNKRTGIMAAALMGMSALHLWYAQEARDYAMVLFLGVLSSYILFKAIRSAKPQIWGLYALISAAGMYTNYFFAVLLIAQIVTTLALRMFRLTKMEMASFAAVIALFFLYLPRFLSKVFYVRGGFWIPRPDAGSLAITFENFMLGYNGTAFLYRVCDILMIIGAACAVYAALREKAARVPVLFCACLVLVPVFLAFAFSRIFFSIYLDRGLMLFSPYFYLIMSAGILYSPKRVRAVLCAVFIAAACIPVSRYFNDELYGPVKHHMGTYIKRPVKPAAAYLDARVGPGDIVGYSHESVFPSLDYYLRSKFIFYRFYDPAFPDSGWNRPISESDYCKPYFKIRDLTFKRLWLIAADWPRTGEIDEHSRSVKKWLDENRTLASAYELDGLYIYCYE